MKRVLLVANGDHPDAVAEMERFAATLKGKAEIAGMVTSPGERLGPFEPDFVVAFGGDGTILNVARRLDGTQVPVLGVNLGRLGYLAEFSPAEVNDGVLGLLNGEAVISPRMMLQCIVRIDGEEVRRENALNDVVISTSILGRIGELAVSVDGKPLTTLRGDGVIIATPTGSTAYSLSAGGPILSPELSALVLTPVCAHELANRPLVASDHEVVSLSASGKDVPICVAVDGHGESYTKKVVEVAVGRSETRFQLVHHPNANRYEILRKKLGWGGGTRSASTRSNTE
jgi:NAD+ kinase